MAFLSSIASEFGLTAEGGLGDDNSAVAAKDDNPYLSGPILAARNAYDAIYSSVRWLAEGKRQSLQMMDMQLKTWEAGMKRIAEKYQEMLNMLDDYASGAGGLFTSDLAKEAWEMIQDIPVLRRYMGEANYWYLHDTLGLLVSEGAAASAEVSAGAKSALKATILGILSATDGLLQVESFLGQVSQFWGGLYQKMLPLPVMDSIVPNVTCAYYYKPTVESVMEGYTLSNPVPGIGFSPIPIPIPDPTTEARYGLPNQFPDYQDPSTWYVNGIVNGTPWYIQSTMDMYWRALNYWGSSYRDAVPPLAGGFYNQREYPDGDHPLMVGKTFNQLDTSFTSVSGGSTASSSIKGILDTVFTEDIVEQLDVWQAAYETMRGIALAWAQENGITTITELLQPTIYEVSKGKVIDTNYAVVLSQYLQNNPEYMAASEALIGAWKAMADAYVLRTEGTYADFFNAVLTALQDVAHATGDLDSARVYCAVQPAALDTYLGPNNVYTFGGLRCLALSLFWEPSPTSDYYEAYGVGRFTLQAARHFVMFPQIDDEELYYKSMYTPVVYTQGVSVLADHVTVSMDTAAITGDSELLRYAPGETWNAADVIGKPPEALKDPDALTGALPYIHEDSYFFCSLLFPDGLITIDGEATSTPETFVSVYRKYYGSYAANEEMANSVGYSIREGRGILFPCFGPFGEFLGMKSWEFKEMPTSEFSSTYARCRSGSDLYYDKSNPGKVVFRHSSYYSDTRSQSVTIYHEEIVRTERRAGEETYAFLVFPTESISIGTHKDGDIDLGSMWPVNATHNGVGYRYIPMRNCIPRCPKYVDPELWSFMDLIHEQYLLAENLSVMCADNGERMANLESLLSEFGLTPPTFIGQLPADNGAHADFQFTIFKQYADRIKEALDSVYSLRDRIFRATVNW